MVLSSKKRTKPLRLKRRLSYEALEPRQLLAVTVVDDFSDAINSPELSYRSILQIGQGTNSGTPTVETDISGVIGGSRQTTVSVTNGQGSARATINRPPGGLLEYDSTFASSSLALSYNGNGTGLNANLAGITGTSLAFANVSLGGALTLPVAVELRDGNDLLSSANLAVTTEGFQTLFIPSTAFAGLGALNLSDVDGIRVSINTQFSAEFTLSLITIDTNQPIGPVSDTDTAADQVAENSALGTSVGITASAADLDVGDVVTYELDGDLNGGGRFAIDRNTGVITVAGPLDFETASSHTVRVRAMSTDGSTSTQDFTISVLDVETIVSVSSVSDAESAGTLDFTITFSSPISQPITLNFSTQDGTARAGQDYTGINNQQITFVPNGSLQQTVSVTILNENLVELYEEFTVVLGNLSDLSGDVSLATGPSATGTILNDDTAAISVTSTTASESDAGLDFIVTLSNPVSETVTLNFSTQDGTALAGRDYIAVANRSITFAPQGSLQQTIPVTVINENLVERDENFSVVLSDLVDSTGSVSFGSPTLIADVRSVLHTGFEVHVVGDRAHVAEGFHGLSILDVSNPAIPVFLGRFDTAGSAQGVQVVGDRAYVANGFNGGLLILDVSSPANPVLLGEYDGDVQSVQVVGNLAYVVDSFHGLVILDVSNPANPVFLGGFDTPGIAQSVHVVGNWAYMTDDSNGLVILDISDPAVPVLLGGFDTAGAALNVAVVADRAYVADGTSGLLILDVSQPASPAFLGEFDTAGFAQSVQVVGGLAYVANGSNGMVILDVSNPTIPILASEFDTSIFTNSVQVMGDLAYVTGVTGLMVLDVTNSANPLLIGRTLQLGASNSVWAHGDLVFVAGRTTLQIISVAQPDHPLGSIVGEGVADAVKVVGNLAYVATGQNGLQIFDVSNPANPTLLGSSEPLDVANALEVVGNLAYLTVVSPSSEQLVIVDVSNPASPTIVERFDTSGAALGLDVVGNRAYLAKGFNGVVILDVSDPANPLPIGSFDTPGFAQSVQVIGDRAYVADGSNGLVILDVSNQALPVLLGGFDAAGSALSVAVVANLAYVADSSNDLVILDVSNPTNPTLLANVPTFLTAVDVQVESGRIFVTGTDGEGEFNISILETLSPVATGSIRNDDTAMVTLASATDLESSGVLNFLVTLSNPVSETVTVNVSTQDGSARAGSDYVTVTNQPVTFNPGESLQQSVPVTIINDNVPEPDEAFTVLLDNLSASTGGVSLASQDPPTAGFIANDDQPIGPISDRDTAADEVRENSPVGTLVRITAFAADPDGDVVTYELDGDLNGGGRFAIDRNTGVITVAGPLDFETFSSHTVRVRATSTDGTTDSHDFTISVLDVETIVSVSPASDTESAGRLDFTVALSSPISQPITLFFSTQDGTARAGQDYVGITSQQVSFVPDGPRQQTVSVTILNEDLVELDEAITVVLDNLINQSGDVSLAPDPSASGTIFNDDAASLIVTSASAQENNGQVELLVTLRGAVDVPFTVDYSTRDLSSINAAVAGVDYTAVLGALAFSGTDGQSQTVRVSLTPDADVERDELFALDLLDVLASGREGDITRNDNFGIILNDDTAVVSIQNIAASESAQSLQFVATLSAPVYDFVQVQFSTADGTATGGSDYTPRNITLSFAPGQTQSTIDVSVNNENVVERDETMTARLGNLVDPTDNVSISVTEGSATGTILNDDAARLVVSNPTGAENAGPLVFAVTLEGQVDLPVTVNYSTADVDTEVIPADFTPRAGTLTFSGQSNESQTLSVSINLDEIVELNESFALDLISVTAGGRENSISTTDGIGTILNDDSARLVVSSPAGPENSGDLIFGIALDRQVDAPVTVNYATTDVGSALAGIDYFPRSGSLTFPAFSAEPQSRPVPMDPDNFVEVNETFAFDLSNLQAAGRESSITLAGGIGTISNDDVDPAIVVVPTPPKDLSPAAPPPPPATIVTFLAVPVIIIAAGTPASSGAGSDVPPLPPAMTDSEAKEIIPVEAFIGGPDTEEVLVNATDVDQFNLIVRESGEGDRNRDLPLVELSAASRQMQAGKIPFVITLAEELPVAVTVRVSTVNGPPETDPGYIPLSQEVIFDAGRKEHIVSVELPSNKNATGNKTVDIQLAVVKDHTGRVRLPSQPPHATGTILGAAAPADSNPRWLAIAAAVPTIVFMLTIAAGWLYRRRLGELRQQVARLCGPWLTGIRFW